MNAKCMKGKWVEGIHVLAWNVFWASSFITESWTVYGSKLRSPKLKQDETVAFVIKSAVGGPIVVPLSQRLMGNLKCLITKPRRHTLRLNVDRS